MQYLHVLEKSNFDLLNRGGEGWGVGANICYHVAAFLIPFNLICSNDRVLKILNFDLSPKVIGPLVLEKILKGFLTYMSVAALIVM